MQTVKQSSDLWPAPSSQVHRIVQFIEPTVTANDFEALRAIKKAASWLMAETVLGLAAYGAAAHPCLWDAASSPHDAESAGR